MHDPWIDKYKITSRVRLSDKKRFRPVQNVREVREQVERFAEQLKHNRGREHWGSMFRSARFWVFDPVSENFAMNSFAGYHPVTMASYYRFSREYGIGAAHGAIKRAVKQSSNPSDLDFAANPKLLKKFMKWYPTAFGVNLFDAKTNIQKWRFLELPRSDNSVPQVEIDIAALEGGSVLYLHLKKERNAKLRRDAVAFWSKTDPNLRCGICKFSFRKSYGELGEGFVEVHHKNKVPKVKSKVTIKDLMPVCANCHRMLHRSTEVLDTEELARSVQRVRK